MKSLDYVLENDDENIVGGVEAYVVNKNEKNWKNFIRKEINHMNVADSIIQEIEKSNIQVISVLKSIGVNEEHRGCGYGSTLMDEYLEFSANNDAQLFLLVADKMEKQEKGFVLNKWYEDYEFEDVYDMSDITFMVWDPSGNLNLKEKIADLKKSANVRKI